MKLPPVWRCKSTTPVKAKTSVPPQLTLSSCTALTRRGLSSVAHTGSRERGGGLRQTLDRQKPQRGRLTVGRARAAGTAWATPLKHRLLALARDLAIRSGPNEAR